MMNESRAGRQRFNLMNELKPLDCYLRDPAVTDIMANPDESLWVKSLGEPVRCVGSIPPDRVQRILAFTASMLNKTINDKSPEIDGILPLDDYPARISGVVPPWSTSPAFCIRKPSERVFTLDDYVRTRRAKAADRAAIIEAIGARRNIVIAGGTGSGKTTLMNALIDTIVTGAPDDRIYIVEDTAEIQCTARNHVSLVVEPRLSAHAVRKSLRFFPDRIIFGELRYGETALELLKAWNTGHPGGITTIHANSADSVINRLRNLLDEVNLTNSDDLIDQSIGLIIYMERGAKINEIRCLSKE